MAINYPGSLDDFTNPSAGNTLDSPSHSGQHSDLNDAVEALEAKVGIGASPAGSATAGQVLTAQGGGTAIWDNLPADASGLIYIHTETFSAASTVSVNDVFSATYDNYKILMNITPSTSLTLNLRWRVSGSDNTTNNYYTQRLSAASTTVSGSLVNDATNIFTLCSASSVFAGMTLEVKEPFTSNNTFTEVLRGRAATPLIELSTNQFLGSTSFTGFSVIPSTGTITGAISVYGYKD